MMKKILFIINSLKCGGAERLLLDIVKAMPKSEYEVSILTFNKLMMFDDGIPENVRILNALNVGSRFSHYSRRLLAGLGLLDRYYRHNIRKAVDRYDTIVSFLEGFPLRAHSYLLDRAEKHLTFVHTDLSTYPDSLRQFPDSRSAARVYGNMDDVIFVSTGAMEGFNRTFPKVNVKRTVLENGIDIASIKEKALKEKCGSDSFSVVTVGRVTEVKGFDLIPRIARIFKEKNTDIHFTIVGDGGYMPKLQQLIKTLDVEEMITLEGFKSNPYPFMNAADIYISTSVTEGLPLSICEAMALGKPVVASPTAGAKELLSDGTGIIVNRTPEEFADAISQFLENQEMLAKYGELSRKKARLYDKDIYMGRLLQLL